MGTTLIRLSDGTLVEVVAQEDQIEQIASKQADKVKESLNNIQPILEKACRPVLAAWQQLSQDMDIDSAEIELGFAFEGEGDLYIVRGKASANLTVKMSLKPKKGS